MSQFPNQMNHMPRNAGLPLLVAASAGMHAAEQMALAALPLTAVLALHADAAVTGVLVAAQGAAALAVSLPAGVIVDRFGAGTVARAAPVLAILGLAAAIAASVLGWVVLLGIAAFVAATGTVLYVGGTNALVPQLVERAALTRANARFELARALVTLPAPALVAYAAARGWPSLGYGFALAGALIALGAVMMLPALEATTRTAPRQKIIDAVREGAAFALKQPILRGILGCALFWNFAYFALVGAYVPFALNRAGFSPEQSGYGLSAYGAGLLVGALTATRLVQSFPPRAILLFGPLSSVIAALFILATSVAPRLDLLLAGWFLIGFGPMLWLICQTTIRQLVTPAALLGRVGATISVAIYGIRPIGAILGGFVGRYVSLDAALWLVVAAFACSALVALFSSLSRLDALPAPAGA